MLVLVGAGLIGAFGSGPLASAHAHGVSYDRVVRREAVNWITVELTGSPSVWIAAETFQSADLERVIPEPTTVSLDGDRMVYHFDRSRGKVRFALRPDRPGIRMVRTGFDDGAQATLVQLVLP